MAARKIGINQSGEGQERTKGVSISQSQYLLRHSCDLAVVAMAAVSV